MFVTHNISEAVAMSSRIVLFSSSPGRIIDQWRLDEDFDRTPGSPAARALADQIRALLPSTFDSNDELEGATIT